MVEYVVGTEAKKQRTEHLDLLERFRKIVEDADADLTKLDERIKTAKVELAEVTEDEDYYPCRGSEVLYMLGTVAHASMLAALKGITVK